MPISKDTMLDYLGSTPNLVGSSLGLGALAVTASTGLAGNFWPVTVALAYGAGVVMTRLARPGADGHHDPQPPTARRAAR